MNHNHSLPKHQRRGSSRVRKNLMFFISSLVFYALNTAIFRTHQIALFTRTPEKRFHQGRKEPNASHFKPRVICYGYCHIQKSPNSFVNHNHSLPKHQKRGSSRIRKNLIFLIFKPRFVCCEDWALRKNLTPLRVLHRRAFGVS